MRIDGSIAPYSPDRGPRSGTAVTPYREAQREVEARREQAAAPASSQGFEQLPQLRRVQASSGGSDNLQSRAEDSGYRPALSSRAAQAIASYSSTASFASEPDAQQVLGLDLYA
ncbi:hypothetical protein I0D00_16455 [Pseudomonas lalucatii]|uniref:Uncharacterized protein n=1 Tax=Pseudomonas lalucatii TaxID=1424203 RepID=A0ABS5Q4F9_9PSED|nr:hypothetical protein [Pseudomonas lalucatii]MBS7663519.1 hypothetical protein [Pseudomonas lalucatii]MBS7725067.1 hypothetical protein [Pseudomonas lalucatii]QVM86971.1 hypothetical protein I0D68_15575 [Pseudomonas lalucatii]